MSRYELAQRSGVSQAVLSRFLANSRGMTTDTLDKLAPVLGLKITAQPEIARKGK
jgi:transcriptional regulator with XRE-family HTH domain